MLANSLSLKIIRGTLLAFRDQLGFSASLLRSDSSFTMPLISWAYIVSAHHPAFPLAYTYMVISVTVPGWMPLYRVVIAMQCTRVQFLAQLAYQTLIVVIVFSAVARPNGQLRQAGVARGVRGHAPPPPEKF